MIATDVFEAEDDESGNVLNVCASAVSSSAILSARLFPSY